MKKKMSNKANIPKKIKRNIPLYDDNSYTEQNFFSIIYLSITPRNENNISLNNLNKNKTKLSFKSFCKYPKDKSRISPIIIIIIMHK